MDRLLRDRAIILANDHEDLDRAVKLVEDVGELVDGVKLNVPLTAQWGKRLVSTVRRSLRDRPIIADFKVADIGFRSRDGWSGTNAKIVSTLADLGFDYFTMHVFPGTDSVAEAVEVAHDRGLVALAIPYMTGRGADVFFNHPSSREHLLATLGSGLMDRVDFGRCETLGDVMICLAEATGVDGFIGPANRPETLARYRRFTGRPILATGIGRQAAGGLTLAEQMNGVRDSCNRVNFSFIVGSLIYASQNPVEEVSKIIGIRDGL